MIGGDKGDLDTGFNKGSIDQVHKDVPTVNLLKYEKSVLLNKYDPDELKRMGLIDTGLTKTSEAGASIAFEVRGDDIVTVETPSNAEKNIIVKPFAKINSQLGAILLSSGAVKEG